LAKDDASRALADVNQALKLQPEFTTVWTTRAGIWFANLDGERAAADLTQAIKLNPTLMEAWCSRVHAYLLLNRLEEAERDCLRCRELGGTIKPEMEQLLRAARQKRKPTARNPS
jgi:Tfp pilus assembly protein PilF